MGHLGAMLGHLGAMLSQLGVMLGDLGAMLGLCWAIMGPSWTYLGLCWAILGLILGHLGAMLGQGGTPENFMSDLCCFFGRAKNTVNYGVFFDYGTPRIVGICSLGWGHGSRASSQKLALLEGNTRQRGTPRAHAILKVGMPFRSGSPGIYCSCL